MYLSCTEQVVKEEIIRSLKQESNLQIVVATVAVGMGVNCAGTRQVIHFGPPSDLESYVQETGCAGRDGLPAVAILLCAPGATRHFNKSKAEYTSNLTNCQRDLLFKKTLIII